MDKNTRKRSSTTDGKGVEHIKCVLTEFEGVLVSHSSMKEKVHDYVNQHAESYLNKNFEEKQVKKVIECLKKEKAEGAQTIPEKGEKEEVLKAVFEHVKLALKNTFCGKLDALVLALLKEAFDKKEITIELHQHVAKCLEGWKAKNFKLVVLSNRSECLVKSIILGGCPNLNENDILVESLDGSPASRKESYVALADKCQFPPSHICFLTCCQNKAVAAAAAGMEVTLLKRLESDKLEEKECNKGEEKKFDKATDKQAASAQSYNTVHCLQEVLALEGGPCKQTRDSSGVIEAAQ